MSDQNSNQKFVRQTTLVKEIARDPYNADLLFSLFSTAIGTEFLDPRTPIPTEKTLEEIVQSMPPMLQLANYSDDSELINAIGAESAAVLRCAILECPSSYALLPSSLEVPEFRRAANDQKRCYQFLAIQSPPTKEQSFQMIKAKYNKSIHLLHGSKPERWNQINRQELRNLSNTKLMVHGSAYGSGISLHPESSVASHYSSPQQNKYKNSILGDELIITGLCEVVELPNRKDVVVDISENQRKIGQLRLNEGNYSLTLEEACIVRYLLVNFDANVNVLTNSSIKITTLDDALKSEV